MQTRPSPAHALALVLSLAACNGPDMPAVDYTLSFDTTATHRSWHVSLVASGLNPDEPCVLTLSTWGEWETIADEYVEVVRATPTLTRHESDPGAWFVEAPAEWNGSLEVEYRVSSRGVGSREQRRHRGLPWHTPTYTLGFESNTLLRLDGVEGRETIRFAPPEGWSVFTSWNGWHDDGTAFEILKPGNALIAMGTPIGRVSSAGAPTVEVAQFGKGSNVCPQVHELTRAFLDRAARTTGSPLSRTVRVFIVDGMSGGTLTSGGLRVGRRGGFPAEPLADSFEHLVTHELFHYWLGGRLVSTSPAMVWFSEGFTEYFSLWHAVALGAVSEQFFADTVLDWQARLGISSMGRVAFADTTVRWRDDDGPNERMAYAGGAMLAFVLDAQLRSRGSTALDLIRDWCASDRREYDAERLRDWLVQHGASDLWDDYIAQPADLPDALETLQAIGYEPAPVPCALAYVGLQTERPDAPPDAPLEQRLRRVTAVDPDGPAARAGVRTGDRVLGYFPRREGQVRAPKGVAGGYRFGLEEIDPDSDEAFLDIVRDGQEIRIQIAPAKIPGGFQDAARPTESAGAYFRIDRER